MTDQSVLKINYPLLAIFEKHNIFGMVIAQHRDRPVQCARMAALPAPAALADRSDLRFTGFAPVGDDLRLLARSREAERLLLHWSE